MAGIKTVYRCANCGHTEMRWQGKCAACGEWNTFAAETQVASPKGASGKSVPPAALIPLNQVTIAETPRFVSGSPEFDGVLGGGIVPGALILLGGDPGIGKSTLALQMAQSMHLAGKSVVYVSGEESPQQIRLRYDRLTGGGALPVLCETTFESVVATLEASQPDIAVIDSIQTMRAEAVQGVVGGVAQLSYITDQLMRLAKRQHTSLLVIGHVTKEGFLAGPKTIEHMVDTVLYLEGERFGDLRMLRSTKNRFGPVGEIGMFEMHGEGMRDVPDISARFLHELAGQARVGSCIAAMLEGNRVVLVEVQALSNRSNFGYPKRTTSGFDPNRLQVLCAIIEKATKMPVSEFDIYINLAGGIKAQERALDVPVALAILSSISEQALPEKTVVFGELGLLGELRKVPQAEKRIKEAGRLGLSAFPEGKKGQFSGNLQAVAERFGLLSRPKSKRKTVQD